MSERRTTTRVTLGTSPARRASLSRSSPFRILLLGDFGGAARGRKDLSVALSDRRPQAVDPDNWSEMMQCMGVGLRLPSELGGDDPAVIPLQSLDELHPDSLIARVPLFERFRRLRTQLLDPSEFDRAAEEVRGWASWTEAIEDAVGEEPVRSSGPATKMPPSELPDNLLDQTLEATQSGVDGHEPNASSPWLEAIRDMVRPFAVPGKPPRQAELLDCVDQATSIAMNHLLHAPVVQTLEANWRSVDFLVRRLPLGTQLKLYLVDTSKEELAADLDARDDLTRTALYQWLVEESESFSGGQPWAVVGGLFEFEPTSEDAQLLAKTAGIACHAGTPFLAGALPALIGCASVADLRDPRDWQNPMADSTRAVWEQLRQWPEADYAGLAIPRWMLRLPYGADTSPTDSFSFEEMPGAAVHENYLWGNASVACIYALADSYSRVGWQLQPASRFEIGDLPLHVFEQDGESLIYPPSEVYLTERAVEAAARRGVNCLVSVRHCDAVQINGLRAITGNALAGWWSGS